MFQIDQPSAAAALPKPASAGKPGFFTDGNPASGVEATIVDADFLNMIMLELLNVVTEGGLTPSKTQYNQVLIAIRRLAQGRSVLADAGTANAYAASNSPPLIALPSSGFVQVLSVAHANTGASTYAPDKLGAKPILGIGLAPLQGGELPAGGIATLLYVVALNVNGGNGAWVLTECTGGAQQIPNATQSQHALSLGQADEKYLPKSEADFAKKAGDAAQTFLVGDATQSQHALSLGQADEKYLPAAKAADTYLAKEDAKAYLRTDAAKKTYVAIADTYDLSTRDDFGTAIQAGTANTLYTPNITKPRGVYLVRPYRNELKCVLTGSAYFMTAFGEFVTGEGSSGSINLTPDVARGPVYDQAPFVVRVTSANATFRFGLGVRGHVDGEGTVTVTAGAGGMSFSVTRIG